MKIRLTEYNEHWKVMYEQEVVLLQTIFGPDNIRFEHFGSTSIPGMKAKPVIDMMCIVEEIDKVDSYNSRMELLGYEAAGEWGIEGRRLFRKGGEERTHHLHVYEKGNPHIDRHLILRDYLRTHPLEADAYRSYKEGLAARYDSTREYSAAKKDFVSAMEQRALAWFRKRGSKKNGSYDCFGTVHRSNQYPPV